MADSKGRYNCRAAHGRLSPADKRLSAAMLTWREASGLTMGAAAAKLGLSGNVWSAVESGEKFALPEFAAAIDALIKVPLAAPVVVAAEKSSESIEKLSAQVNGLRAGLSACMKRLAALESSLGVETATENMTAVRLNGAANG